MATLTTNISNVSITVSGNTQKSATISWTLPSIPSGATISSCTLTGRATASMSKGSATIKVNETTISSGSDFTINLGSGNTTSQVTATAVGNNKNASGTVTFSNLVYTVNYTEPVVTYTVQFIDWDGTILSEQTIKEGSSAITPPNPTRDGYVFTGWDVDFTNVTQNLIVTAQYEQELVQNIFPPFNIPDTWDLESSCTLLDAQAYSCSFETTSTWSGLSISIPDSWYGKIIELECETISDNAGLYIQETDNWDDIGVLKSNSKKIQINIPEKGTYTDIVIALQAPSTVGTISISGVRAKIVDIDDGGDDDTDTDGGNGSDDDDGDVDINGNIFPPFNIPDTWDLDSSCTLLDAQAYDYSFQTTSTWTGLAISVPDLWYGKVIELECESISDNAGLYIQETDGWSEIGLLESDSKIIQIIMPEKGIYTDIMIILQAPVTAGIISISGVSAKIVDIDDDGDIDDDDGNEDTNEITYLNLGNRIVGYKKQESEPIAANAVICQTVSQVITALSNATSGTTIYLKRGTYTFPGDLEIEVQGAADNYISIKGYPEETVIISGTMITFSSSAKYINFENIKVANLSDLDWDYAIKVYGGASYINFRNIEIYNINCKEVTDEEESGCNPLVLYGDATEPITNVNIENCYIHDCDTGWSEALTLNGNVENCIVRNCTINNITNIGIDLAGNYEWTGTVGDANNQARNCIVENCLIMNCQSSYATSAGLYSDGARDLIFRYNVIYNCQCGIELGSEEPGSASQNLIVHNNLIIDSGRCIGVGSYLETGAPNLNTYIYNNTLVCGDSNKSNYGLCIERTENLNFYNNIIYGTANTKMLRNYQDSVINIGNNCWYQPSGEKPAIDTTGIFANPLFINNDLTINGDYQLLTNSPCIDAGINVSPNYVGDTDLNGNMRISNNIIDIGSFENLDINIYTVSFKDWDGAVLKTQEVESGGSATAPSNPIRDGYAFIGWDVDFTNVTSNLTVTAQYKKVQTNLRVKENGGWTIIGAVYKKVSGIWALQENVTESMFNSNSKYIRKN